MKKWLVIIAVAAMLSGIAVAAYVWMNLYRPVFDISKSEIQVRIRKGWDLNRLSTELKQQAGLKDTAAFVYWMQKLGYKTVKPCFLKVTQKITMKELANELKSLRNQTVNVTIRGSMDAKSIARVLASKIEVDSAEFMALITTSKKLSAFNMNDTTWPAYFIPNTYNLFTATELTDFMERMLKEYKAFWNADKLTLAGKQGLVPLQVSIIASIVTRESNQTSEYKNIAGVYINRLRKGMLLQADPTVTFARGYEGRVLFKDLEVNSPYNTYKHKGLPPGPICIPNISSIEAVLNYESHNYLYFCASPELNGFHSFAADLGTHNKNRVLYLAALKKLNNKQQTP